MLEWKRFVTSNVGNQKTTTKYLENKIVKVGGCRLEKPSLRKTLKEKCYLNTCVWAERVLDYKPSHKKLVKSVWRGIKK